MFEGNNLITNNLKTLLEYLTMNNVIIIGAGLAGLTCAKYLRDRGLSSIILEASDGVGGRARTDKVGGFTLDRGFHVFLTAYPETQRLLDYNRLQLNAFESGAVIRQPPGFTVLGDPFRSSASVFSALASPVGSLSDKLRVLRLTMETEDADDLELFRHPTNDTLTFLQDYGFTGRMISDFFRPFFGGVFLENSLTTSAHFFRFVFKYFYAGDATLPAQGIQAVAEQIQAMLPSGTVQTATRVARVEGTNVYLDNGQALSADTVVLAVDAHQADVLLGLATTRTFNHTTCTYFAANRSPLDRKMIVLNPDRASAVHNLCVPSDIAPGYAPDGQALISVSTQGLETVNEAALTEKIKRELSHWYGPEVAKWQHLRTYHLPEALLHFGPKAGLRSLKLGERLYQCGDQTAYPSLNAAMQTGREVAELIAR
ncbi:MAG: FAD-dependent oxidoreductase [Cytophagaceae bacterium]|nr:FAD-dependent oxidoreductase [Cytophagaceae bacterium]